jgi:nucleotide-binding universal stress UspA family protein
MTAEAGSDELTGGLTEIVVGISDAPTSHIAARMAVKLALQSGARVHFVTAVEESTRETVGVSSDAVVIDTLDLARERVEHFVRSLGVDVAHTITAVEASPARALLSHAEYVGADLIVVGNVRMQGIGRVLGSVGHEVLRAAPCSVLIVKTV